MKKDLIGIKWKLQGNFKYSKAWTDTNFLNDELEKAPRSIVRMVFKLYGYIKTKNWLLYSVWLSFCKNFPIFVEIEKWMAP